MLRQLRLWSGILPGLAFWISGDVRVYRSWNITRLEYGPGKKSGQSQFFFFFFVKFINEFWIQIRVNYGQTSRIFDHADYKWRYLFGLTRRPKNKPHYPSRSVILRTRCLLIYGEKMNLQQLLFSKSLITTVSILKLWVRNVISFVSNLNELMSYKAHDK